MEDGSALDRYVVTQTDIDHPKVCFLPQAAGENALSIVRFYEVFMRLGCEPSHLSLFSPHTADIESFLMDQHAIYVGGGNTKSMLALWREWGLDRILRVAADKGTVLAGVSAGAICWFEQPFSDSIPGKFIRLNGLGYLTGSCSPHYDGEPGRRPVFQRMIASGELAPGYAFDDGAAGHFVDGQLKRVVSSRAGAKGYRVERRGDESVETMLPTDYLG